MVRLVNVFVLVLTYKSDRKLSDHARTSTKRREPGLQSHVKLYNNICHQMKALAGRRRGLRRVILPKPIDPQNVFALDVDDDIWQDTGLDEDDDTDNAAPEWLTDDTVRKAIRLTLLHDRCVEEEDRLRKERWAMQDWVYEEWMVVLTAQRLNSKTNI
jgi:hypothetical protein